MGDDSTIQKPMTYVCIIITFHEKKICYKMQYLGSMLKIIVQPHKLLLKLWDPFEMQYLHVRLGKTYLRYHKKTFSLKKTFHLMPPTKFEHCEYNKCDSHHK